MQCNRSTVLYYNMLIYFFMPSLCRIEFSMISIIYIQLSYGFILSKLVQNVLYLTYCYYSFDRIYTKNLL